MLSIISGAVDQCLGPGADRLLFESLVEAALASEVGVASVFLFFLGANFWRISDDFLYDSIFSIGYIHFY